MTPLILKPLTVILQEKKSKAALLLSNYQSNSKLYLHFVTVFGVTKISVSHDSGQTKVNLYADDFVKLAASSSIRRTLTVRHLCKTRVVGN